MMRRLIVLLALLFVCGVSGGVASAAPISAQLSVNVVSSVPTPPPQAVAAGYTTLAYDFEPATHQNIPSWFDCANTNKPGFEWYNGNGPNNANFSCAKNLSIVTDPTDGKPVLDYHYFSNTDPTQCTANGCYTVSILRTIPYPYPTSQTAPGQWPIGSYTEVRWRGSPAVNDTFHMQFPFDIFDWSTLSPLTLNNHGPIEKDFMEANGDRPSVDGSAVHDWGASNKGAGNGYIMNAIEAVAGQNWSAGVTQMHSYGWLTTSDGISKMQHCMYVDNILVQNVPTHPLPFQGNNCFYVNDFSATTSPCYQNQQFGYDGTGGPAICTTDETYHITNERDHIIAWFGGLLGPQTATCLASPQCVAEGGQPDQDTYIEYIRVWTCPNFATDYNCSAPVGIYPQAVAATQINGGQAITIPATSPIGTPVGNLSAQCVSGHTTSACPTGSTYSLATIPAGTCGDTSATGASMSGADNAKFTISGSTLNTAAALTAGGGKGPGGTYVVCVKNALANYTPQATWLSIAAQ